MLSAILIVLCGSAFFLSRVEGQKKDTLALLYTIPFTGREGMNGDSCRDSAQVAINIANKRTDVLPDYFVDVRFADEFVGNHAVRRVMEFKRSFDDIDPTSRIYQSPLILGFQYSNGCKAAGAMLHYVNSVGISLTAGAPFLADHKLTKNLYLNIQPGQATGLAELHFIRSIGKWNRFAIVTNAGNVNDYQTALFMQKVALDIGMDVAWFDMALDVDDKMVLNMKDLDIRIIVFYTAVDAFLYKFLCTAYRLGMTGPRYIFLLSYVIFADPLKLQKVIPVCTREMLAEQYRYSYWFGPTMKWENSSITSEFGQTQADFDNALDQYTNSSRPADYLYHYVCYDTVVKGLYALNDAEEKLKTKYNTSLRDYRTQPELVMKVVNQSLLEGRRSGLRIGMMSYNKLARVEGDAQVIGYYSKPDNGFLAVANLLQWQNSVDFAYDSYYIAKLRPLKWETENGQPPRDKPIPLRIMKDVPEDVFIGICVAAATLAICKAVALVISLAFQGRNSATLHDRGYLFGKAFGCFGSIAVDVSAALFVAANETGVELARISILTIGLSITHGVLIMRLFAFIKGAGELLFKDKGRKSTVMATNSTNVARSPVRPILVFPESTWKEMEKFTIVGATTFAIMNGVLLALWLGRNVMACLSVPFGPSTYNEEMDTVIQVVMQTCDSPEMGSWILAIVLFHVAVLLLAAFVGFRFGVKVKGWGNWQLIPEFNLMRYGIANAVTLLLAIILAVTVVRDPVNTQITISIGSLITSCFTAVSWFYPLLKGAASNQNMPQ